MNAIRNFLTNLPAMICLLIVVILFLAVYILNGDGGLKRMTTLSGIYTVEPRGHEAVCFVERSSGSVSCLPKRWLDGGAS